MTERSPLLKEMDGLLASAIKQNCHEVTIDLLQQAIMHQQLSEDVIAQKPISRTVPSGHAAADQDTRNAGRHVHGLETATVGSSQTTPSPGHNNANPP